MTAIEEISKWLSSYHDEADLNFQSVVTGDEPNFYNIRDDTKEVRFHLDSKKYMISDMEMRFSNSIEWNLTYIYSTKTWKRYVGYDACRSDFDTAMGRLTQTFTPDKNNQAESVNGPGNIFPIDVNEFDPEYSEIPQDQTCINIAFVFYDAFHSNDEMKDLSEDERRRLETVKQQILENYDLIYSLSPQLGCTSEHGFNPNIIFPKFEINHPRLLSVQDRIETIFLELLKRERIKDGTIFDLNSIKEQIRSISSDMFVENKLDHEYYWDAFSSNYYMQYNESFNLLKESLKKIAVQQENTELKRVRRYKLPDAEQRFWLDGTCKPEINNKVVSCESLRRIMASSWSEDKLRANLIKFYIEKDRDVKKAHDTPLCTNKLQAYYGIPTMDDNKYREENFSFFRFYDVLRETLRKNQILVNCNCQIQKIRPSLWRYLHFYDSMDRNIDVEFGHYGDRGKPNDETATQLVWNYPPSPFKVPELDKLCRENIQSEIKMKYTEQSCKINREAPRGD